MIGRIFITRTGYDPECGKHVKDPYLGANASLGACRPDVRRQVDVGDYIFTITGKVPGASQYIMGGLQVAEKISAKAAYWRFPGQRLKLLPGGQLAGNIIVDETGAKHPLDVHKAKGFDARIQNYIVGRNPVAVSRPDEVARARAETMRVLRVLFAKEGETPAALLGRGAPKLTEEQVRTLLRWLEAIKRGSTWQPRVA